MWSSPANGTPLSLGGHCVDVTVVVVVVLGGWLAALPEACTRAEADDVMTIELPVGELAGRSEVMLACLLGAPRTLPRLARRSRLPPCSSLLSSSDTFISRGLGVLKMVRFSPRQRALDTNTTHTF